ncbi:hypothetical protein [Bifidobacterium adolescentis]|uniref:hypothetical protein n=1 Tax=Bifidobacterium adolescentis TaxID=1680 RepID=UPI000F5F50F2|nr:hypothetical protein [Bifidobacterium adolescentis]
MSSHVELNPDDSTLGLSLGMKAMRLALTQKTHKMGTVRIPGTGGTDVIIGAGASDGANRIDQDGRQLPLVDTSGIDKAAQDARKAADDAAAKADEAIKQGEQIRRDAQAGIDDARKQAQAADAKTEQVRTDLTKQVQNVKSEMDSAVEAVQTSANKAQSAADAAQKAADKANASTIDLDKSIKAVDAKAIAAKQAAAEAQSKAENVASDLDSANAVIEQHTTELGELTTKVSNAVKKSDSALNVSTEAKQTATEASTTASSAYKDSQTALTQSTTATQTATAAKTTAESASKTASDSLKQSSAAVQTANQISTTLRTEYQTKADADKIYATQSSLKQTSDSITASVSKTYATKDALSALQNVADNAIESWRGTGVPTLTNKPASDWTTDADKRKHSGDLYYDKSTGKAYRFGSDDGVTYTWELNQDTDVTKALADASKAQTSANNAQASATAANTAAGKAQSTANTAVSNAATAKNAADAAQSSANKAQGDVDKLKIDIPETYATKSSLSQTAESITANVESVKTTANSAVTAASKAQQTADGISVNLTKNYQTKSQADTLYATKASLKATSDSISAEVTKAQGTADGAVTAASKAQQTADAVTLNLSKNYQTKAQNDALYATQTSLKATSDSLSANITANAKTAQSAVDKATSLEANLNGFKTTVSETYTTKTDFNNLTVGGTNLLLNSNFSKGTNNWVRELQNNGYGTVTAEALSGVDFATTMLTINVTKNTSNICRIYQLRSPNPMRTDTIDTISFWATASEITDVMFGAFSNPKSITIKQGWHYYKATVPKWNDSNAFSIIFKNGFIGTLKITNIMWEHASKASQWSPAPEDLQPAGDYATNSSLTQTANSIKAQVTEVSKTANSAMSKATTVEQTANGLSSKITEQGKTLNATVKTANEAKSTADSNKTAISQVSTTASSALTKASTVEQNLNGFKMTVSETYSTKDDVRNLTISGTNLLLVDDLITCYVDASTGLPVDPYAGKPDGNWVGDVSTKNPIAVSANSTYVLTAYDSMPNTTGFTGRISQFDASGKYINIALNVTIRKAGSLEFTTASTAASIYVGIYACPKYRWKLEKKLQPAGDYATNSSLTQTANQIRGEVSEKYQSKSGMSSYATTSALTQKANEITGKVTEVAKTATGAMGKASSVEQTASALSSKLSETVRTLDSTVQTVNTVKSTADSNKATLMQVAKTASDASSRASSVEQNLNGFKTTVSQTYGRGSNLWVNPTFDPDKPQITSRVNNVTAPNGSGVNLLASRDHCNGATSFPVVPGHTYVITAHIKCIKGDLSLRAGIWYTKQTSGQSFDTYVGAESTSNLSDGWMAATWRFTCPNGKSRGCVFFQIEQSANNGSTQWYVANVVCVDVTGLQPAGDYATKSYVNQNAKTIALGVVENYKGSDGSGLATKSDITVAKKSITSTVASTYATKSGVTQEISSKITQNNNSLDVKFATKTETKTAQATANAAKSDASDAKSRVGTLEDCISLTSAGVRAGHQSNGVFDGVSALVNTDGSFDLLDKDGNLLTRIYRHGLQVAGDDGVGSGHLILSQDGLDITVQPTANEKVTYHIQLGAGGISITAPDGAHVECSARTGLDLETVKYGKLSIGSGGLQFTNDRGWGLALSAAGWSLKWAGNHTLATGPTAGALYIDGRQIVTR